MYLSGLKGSIKMMSGKLIHNIGAYTGNNSLYFLGKRMEIMGRFGMKYGHMKYVSA